MHTFATKAYYAPTQDPDGDATPASLGVYPTTRFVAARNWHWGAVGFYYTAPATSSVKKASDDLAADMTDVDRIDQVDKFNRKMRRLNIPLQATVPFGPGLAWPERTTGGAALMFSARATVCYTVTCDQEGHARSYPT